jgi:arginine repressor
MAKTASGTKSAAIQEYLAANKAASPKQIVEALHQKGVEVSFGLASAVKYGKKGKKSSVKKAGKATAAKGKPAVSGSESIRQFIAKHPNAKAKEIEIGLKQQGIRVTPGLISSVMYGGGRKAGKKKRSTRVLVVHAAARRTSVSVTVEQLLEVKKFADSIGGADQVRQALDMLEQLR